MLKKISQFQISLEESIVNYCDTLSTKKRLLSVIILSSFFGLATLYIMVSAFHNIKKASARQMKIEQIKQLHLHSSDSVQQLKLKYHEEDKEAKKHKSPANDTTLRDWELRKYWQRSTWINGKVLSNSSKSIAFTEKTKDNNEPSIN